MRSVERAAGSPAPSRGPSRYFRDGEPVWREIPAGPVFGSGVWDLASVLNRANQAERRLDFTAIQDHWALVIQEILMVLTQPDHPSVVTQGVIRRGDPCLAGSVVTWFHRFRVIAAWASEREVGGPEAWTAHEVSAFKVALEQGTHREGGTPLSPGAKRHYIEAVKMLREFGPVLSCGGLTFEPWPSRKPAQIARDVRPVDNVTPPLPWDVWAATVKASWAIVDRFSSDILAAASEAGRLPKRACGSMGAEAEQIFNDWARSGGRVPLHTGHGKGAQQRGQPNYTLLTRKLGISSNTLRSVHPYHKRRLKAQADAMAADPDRSEYGGIWTPAVMIPAEDGTGSPWVGEIGYGETDFLISVLRAAAYLLLAALTGMRDSELQSVTKDAVTTHDGLPAIRGIQTKGENGWTGKERPWWAPKPVLRVIEVLTALSPHANLVFGRSPQKYSVYDSHRDIARLIHFVDAEPGTRICRGNGLGLDPIKPGSYPLNQSTMRRSFAVYASRYPAAELGLGIQLGHAALRMTSGYSNDSQQQVARLFDTERRRMAREQVAKLTTGEIPAAGGGAKSLAQFHAQIIADPGRADRIADTIADRYHLGIFNDCMWDPARAGCGGDRPKLAEGLCIGPRCSNATFVPRHLPVVQQHVARIDDFLDAERGHPDIRASLRKERATYAAIIEELTDTADAGNDTEHSQP